MFLGTSGVAILNQETRVLFCLATVSFDFLERVSILDRKVGLLKVVDRQGNFFQFSYGSGFGKKKRMENYLFFTLEPREHVWESSGLESNHSVEKQYSLVD